jgi:hypothetical protein
LPTLKKSDSKTAALDYSLNEKIESRTKNQESRLLSVLALDSWLLTLKGKPRKMKPSGWLIREGYEIVRNYGLGYE